MRHPSHPLLAALLLALPALAEDRPIHSAFGPGEQTSYQVSYLGVPTGTATVSVGLKMQQFGKDVWPIVCTAVSELSVFPVHDRFISYWDYDARRNVGSEFVVDENKKRRREKNRYDREAKKIFSTKQREGSPPVEATSAMTDGVLDLAATAMSVRNQPLKPGDELTVPIFTGLITYQMKAKVEGREKISTPLGEKDCVKVSFNAEWSGMLSPRGPLLLWFTDDAQHLPVRFQADLLLGAIVAEATASYPGRDYTR